MNLGNLDSETVLRATKRVRSYWQNADAAAIAEVVNALVADPTSCVWHEVTKYYRRHDTRARCTLCGSRGLNVPHAICTVLARLGKATPALDDTIPCPCARCAPPDGAP